jgi:hypothetical protein
MKLIIKNKQKAKRTLELGAWTVNGKQTKKIQEEGRGGGGN